MNILWYDALAAFVCAILSGMGVGGGGLFLIYLSLVRHCDIFLARQLNLLCFLCGSAASLLRKPKESEGYRPLKPFCWWVIFLLGILGALCGKLLLLWIDASRFSLFLGIFFCLCGLFALLRAKKKA
jgi:uncharacterized membrane protein YfcA